MSANKVAIKLKNNTHVVSLFDILAPLFKWKRAQASNTFQKLSDQITALKPFLEDEKKYPFTTRPSPGANSLELVEVLEALDAHFSKNRNDYKKKRAALHVFILNDARKLLEERMGNNEQALNNLSTLYDKIIGKNRKRKADNEEGSGPNRKKVKEDNSEPYVIIRLMNSLDHPWNIIPTNEKRVPLKYRNHYNYFEQNWQPTKSNETAESVWKSLPIYCPESEGKSQYYYEKQYENWLCDHAINKSLFLRKQRESLEQIQIMYDDYDFYLHPVVHPRLYFVPESPEVSDCKNFSKQSLHRFFQRYDRRETLDKEPELAEILMMKNDEFKTVVQCTFLYDQDNVSVPIWLPRSHLELNNKYKQKITEYLKDNTISQERFIEEVDDI